MKTLIVFLFSLTSFAYAADQDLKEKVLNLVNERPMVTTSSLPLSRHVSVLDRGEGKHKTIYVGKRQPMVSKSEFVREMNKHISIVRDLFKDKGLVHYSVYLTEEYELAVQEWKSEKHAQDAFASSGIASMREHAERILSTVAFAKVDEIICSNVKRNDLSYRFIRLDDEFYKHQVVRKADRRIVYQDVLEWLDVQGTLVMESKKTSVNMEYMDDALYTYTGIVNGQFKEITESLNCEEL